MKVPDRPNLPSGREHRLRVDRSDPDDAKRFAVAGIFGDDDLTVAGKTVRDALALAGSENVPSWIVVEA